jgi:hypothetical protein
VHFEYEEAIHAVSSSDSARLLNLLIQVVNGTRLDQQVCPLYPNNCIATLEVANAIKGAQKRGERDRLSRDVDVVFKVGAVGRLLGLSINDDVVIVLAPCVSCLVLVSSHLEASSLLCSFSCVAVSVLYFLQGCNLRTVVWSIRGLLVSPVAAVVVRVGARMWHTYVWTSSELRL